MDEISLPVPSPASTADEAPQGSTETALAAIWADLLQRERIGRNDNFFELSGDSLLVMRMATRVQKALKIEVKVTDFFLHPVLADLARVIERAAPKELTPVRRVTARKPAAVAARPYKTATGPGGRKIISRDNGITWYDAETGKVVD